MTYFEKLTQYHNESVLKGSPTLELRGEINMVCNQISRLFTFTRNPYHLIIYMNHAKAHTYLNFRNFNPESEEILDFYVRTVKEGISKGRKYHDRFLKLKKFLEVR